MEAGCLALSGAILVVWRYARFRGRGLRLRERAEGGSRSGPLWAVEAVSILSGLLDDAFAQRSGMHGWLFRSGGGSKDATETIDDSERGPVDQLEAISASEANAGFPSWDETNSLNYDGVCKWREWFVGSRIGNFSSAISILSIFKAPRP